MFEFSSTSYSGKAGDTINVTIRRVSGSNGAVAVGFRTLPLTALDDKDYKPVDINVSFPNSVVEQVVSIDTKEYSGQKDGKFFVVMGLTIGGPVTGFNDTAVINLIAPPTPTPKPSSKSLTLALALVLGPAAIVIIIIVVWVLVKRGRANKAAQPLLLESGIGPANQGYS
jgi:hypothetical protein